MRKLALFALCVALVTAAVGASLSSPLGATDQARWTAADSESLASSIARLEERLLADQARVRFWAEMRTRHEDVSAVACANLGDHAVAMERNAARFQVRVADQRRRRVASASVHD